MGIKLPSRQLTSQQDAALIQRADVPRSSFSGSWTHQTTFDAGFLIPFLIEEVLPGDHLTFNVTAYVRMATPLFPMFSNQRVDTFFFYVPNRLVWTNWVKMMGEQEDPDSSIDYTVPVVVSPAGGFSPHSIYDHAGLPTSDQLTNDIEVSALPFRAYTLIYNEWFRDQNLQDSLPLNKTDTPDSYTAFGLVRRAKSHDYFTSCLPWAQKFEAPTVPLLGEAWVKGIGVKNGVLTAGPLASFESPTGFDDGATNYAEGKIIGTALGDDQTIYIDVDEDGPKIYADLAQATGVSINQLRQAWMVQQLLERDARGGTRYTEQILSQFNVRNPDFRLQRPEYIGGGQTPLTLTPIAQTVPTATEPLGAIGAAGTAAGTHRASYAATEHGYIIGLINVRSELAYQQGIRRHWSRQTRLDFYTPALGGLGEQAILQKEIYALGVPADDNTVFGYQEAWHEYRTHYSEVTGYFRSQATGTLDMWHLSQVFNPAPVLGDTFIQDDPPMDRVLAAGVLTENQQYLADILINATMVRPIPTYGTPAAIGRF